MPSSVHTDHGRRAQNAELIGAWVRTARPRQWTKNLLVAAAPAAAGVLGQPNVLLRVAAAFLLFSLAASGAYFLNDALDSAADRHHPTKRKRPIAAGLVPVRAAVVAGLALLSAGVAGAVWLGPAPFALSVFAYVAATMLYSAWLKHVAVVDLVIITLGFIVRAVAGGLVVGLPLTTWFLIVVSFGALFVVSGKRHTEVAVLGRDGADHRRVLQHYTSDYTQHLLTLSSGVTIVAYCLWAFEVQDGPGALWLTMSVLPFVTALLRYGLLLHRGEGGEPEEIFLRDRGLQALALIWVACIAFGVYSP